METGRKHQLIIFPLYWFLSLCLEPPWSEGCECFPNHSTAPAWKTRPVTPLPPSLPRVAPRLLSGVVQCVVVTRGRRCRDVRQWWHCDRPSVLRDAGSCCGRCNGEQRKYSLKNQCNTLMHVWSCLTRVMLWKVLRGNVFSSRGVWQLWQSSSLWTQLRADCRVSVSSYLHAQRLHDNYSSKHSPTAWVTLLC